jgi:hypothetical protein
VNGLGYGRFTRVRNPQTGSCSNLVRATIPVYIQFIQILSILIYVKIMQINWVFLHINPPLYNTLIKSYPGRLMPVKQSCQSLIKVLEKMIKPKDSKAPVLRNYITSLIPSPTKFNQHIMHIIQYDFQVTYVQSVERGRSSSEVVLR